MARSFRRAPDRGSCSRATPRSSIAWRAIPRSTACHRRARSSAGASRLRKTSRFCFKFPRAITHELRLRKAEDAARAFLARLAPLGQRLGPIFVQLPPSFGPDELSVLLSFLDHLPVGRYAVEVRHPAFFASTLARDELDDGLRARGIDRVLLDTRPLHSAEAIDNDIRQAQQQKPKVPLYAVTTAERPLLRYIGHPDVDANTERLGEWAERVAGWIAAGKTPHVFLHMPDDFYSPHLARRFHDLLSQHVDAGELASWPVAAPARPTSQLDLF